MLKKIGKIALMLAIMVGFCWAADALASGDLVGIATGKLSYVFKSVRSTLLLLHLT